MSHLQAKTYPIRPLKIIIRGSLPIVCCPACDSLTIPVRYCIKDDYPYVTYRCQGGHYFCSFREYNIEWRVGDVVHIGELVKKHKERYENR